MSQTFNVELIDTESFWMRRATVTMPELTHYGYDGSTNYVKANRVFERELMRRAKAAMGMSGVRGVRSDYGDTIDFRPYGQCVVMFVTPAAI